METSPITPRLNFQALSARLTLQGGNAGKKPAKATERMRRALEDETATDSQSVVLNSISRIMRHQMCDNVQSHSLSPNVCFLRVCGTGAYDLKDRMQGRFTGVTLMEHLRAGIIRHSRDVLMVARWIAHGHNIEA